MSGHGSASRVVTTALALAIGFASLVAGSAQAIPLCNRPTPPPACTPEGPQPRPHLPAPPPFQAATYTFHLDSVVIDNTRSRHEDSDKVSLSAAVGNGTPETVTTDMGDVNNGSYALNLNVGPVSVDDPKVGVAFHYVVLNSGHQDWEKTNGVLSQVTQTAASKGAQAITSAAGAAVGAAVGNVVMPVVGAVVGYALTWAAGQVTELLTANCDGIVAEAQVAMSGQDLWDQTSRGNGTTTRTFFHPGTDSPHGCGSNSEYWTTYTITRS